MVTPKTFLVVVAGILAFAYITQPFLPLPYQMVKQVDSVAVSVLEAMQPGYLQRPACTSDLLASDC